MIVSFELTMPNVASWNGRWSGEGKKYFIIRKFTGKASKEVISKLFVGTITPLEARNSWYYRWEDGWGANVEAEIVDAYTANKRKKVSSGFCGYDWMVDSILKNGKIQTS